MRSVVVVGGTGPTGFALVERLVAAGDRVTIVHTGQHEIGFSGPVEHVHCDPRSRDDLAAALGRREFDAAISTSGRLREVVAVLANRIGSLAAVTGLPAYAGWLATPGRAGRPMPLRETDPPARPVHDAPGDGLTQRVLANERAVLDAAAAGAFRAAVLRYTMVYGPYSYIPFEWYFVRRVLDGRRRLVLEADGLMLPQRGYAENLAAAVLLALDEPQADGRVFNVGDEHVLSVRAIADTVAEALGHEFEAVSVPLVATPCRNPFALRQNTVFDLGAIRDLGYRDVVPVAEATRRAARWLADNPVGRGSSEEASLGAHAFDYAAEDHAIAVYDRALVDAGSARFFPGGAGDG
jgi:nucleoside-diphosphate-sugar epimerase